MTRLNLPINTISVNAEPKFKEELLKEGGKTQVPCLKIENGDTVNWLYESKAIMAYLQAEFEHNKV